MRKRKGGTFIYDPNEVFRDQIHKLFATEDFSDIQAACKAAINIIKPTFRSTSSNSAFADLCFKILTNEDENIQDRWVLLKTLDSAITNYIQTDPVTFDDIPAEENDRITFLENGTPFAFSKTTLNSLGKKENPLTRQPLPDMVQNVATTSDAFYKKYLSAAVIKDPVERAAALYALQHSTQPSAVRTRRSRVYNQ